MHVEVRGQSVAASSLLLLCRTQELNSGQAWHQASLPTTQSRTMKGYLNVLNLSHLALNTQKSVTKGLWEDLLRESAHIHLAEGWAQGPHNY